VLSLGIAGVAAFALFLLSIFNEGRKGICTLLALGSLLHMLLADILFYLDGLAYYGTSSLACGILIAAIVSQNYVSVLAKDVLIMLFVCILINFSGWILYESYAEPVYYNVMMGLFYLALIARLLIRTNKDGRGSHNIRRRVSVIHSNYPRMLQGHQERQS
jgi:hypothetical protein